MTLTLLLHGNPGSAADLEPLAAALRAAGDDVRAVERPAGGDSLRALVDSLDRAATGDRLRVIGYSYGAWLAMQHATRGGRKPDALVLVNPYLVVERPLSSAAAAIATAPVLGGAIMRRKAPALADQFVEDVFAPAGPPAALGAELRARLNDPAVWQGALRYKRLQQAEALAPIDALPCPTRVLIGSADRVADWKRQMTAFGQALTAIDLHTIEDAGHALPWTHPEEVARIAREDSQ